MGECMINYSVFMMPNPMDKDAAPKAYAKAQVSEVLSFRNFTKHIAEHGGYTRGKVKGVISDMCQCLVEMLLEGKKVQLDELGDFWVSLSCEGAESCESFTSNAIKGLKIVFTPGVDFENLINKAEFSPVASRAAQSAILKAEKTGQKTVDLEAAKKKPNAEGDNKPSGDNGATGGTHGGGEQTGGSGNTGENGDNSDNTENG